MSAPLGEVVPPRLDVNGRRAIYERCSSAFRALLSEALAAYAGDRVIKTFEACLWIWTTDADFFPEQIGGDTLRQKLQNGRAWWQLCHPVPRPREPLTARTWHDDHAEWVGESFEDPFDRAQAELTANESEAIVARHREALAEVLVSLRQRTSSRLALAWVWAARRHLAVLRGLDGALDDELESGGGPVGRPKDGALAGALYLVLLCDETDSLNALDRALVEAAYLPPDGGTDHAPYTAHRMPDGELAARVHGSRRGHAREVRDQLLRVLFAMTERWWTRFAKAIVHQKARGEQLVAHLAWETFTPTVYDVWRLEDLRPMGRSDLDFQRWRGRDDMDRKPRGRGRKPPGPAGGLPAEAAAAYVRGELSREEELGVARYLMSFASTGELRQIATLAESVAPGAMWLSRLRAIAVEASARLISFPVRLENGVPVPAMLDGRDRSLDDGEVVAICVNADHAGSWVAVFRRTDGGGVDWAQRWTPLPLFPEPVEVCGYALDDAETEVELLVSLLWEEPPEEADAVIALAALAELGSRKVLWRSCRLVRRGR